MKILRSSSVPYSLILGICSQISLPAATLSSSFTGGDPSDNWNATANWSPVLVPNNNGTNQFNVTLPSSLPAPVNLDISPTLNSLTIGNGTTLMAQPNLGLTLLGDIANDGLVELAGTSSTARLFFNHPTDEAITLGGSGILRFTGGAQNISGASGQQLVHGSGHTIEGFQTNLGASVGQDLVNIVNQGTIQANVAGQTLRLDPQNTLENTGTLSATGGGALRFAAGVYSGSGEFLIGDSSEIVSDGASFTDVTFTAVDDDSDDQNNIFRAIGTTNLNGTSFAAGVFTTAEDRTFNLVGDVTNNGVIELTGIGSTARLFIDHPADQAITLDGSGVLRFTGGAQNITGATGQQFVNGPVHTIEGFQTNPGASIGQNLINIDNQGTIMANVVGETLTLDPQNTFENSGTLSATGGGKLRFAAGLFSGSGDFLIEDNSEILSNGASFIDVTFTAVNDDSDDQNNIFRGIGTTILDGATFGAGVFTTAEDRTFNLVGDVTNNGVIQLTGTSITARLFIDHPSDEPITLGGSGILRLTGEAQNITGAVEQQFINGPGHTIEGFQTNSGVSIGQNLINMANLGTIQANVAGETLRLDQRSETLLNSGVLRSKNGATLVITDFGITNSGTIEAEANSTIQIGGGVTNSGDVRVGTNSTIDIELGLSQTMGMLDIDGELNLGPERNGLHTITIQGGRLAGSGLIVAEPGELLAGNHIRTHGIQWGS